MDIRALVATASHQDVRRALNILLEPHFQPAFGAVKQIEHEIAALRVLKLLRALSLDADEYEFGRSLRVTKAKARSLMYQDALRASMTDEQVKQNLKAALRTARVAKDGETVLVELPDPFLMDDMRSRVRKRGFLSDGSFSGSIARMSSEELSGLIALLFSRPRKIHFYANNAVG